MTLLAQSTKTDKGFLIDVNLPFVYVQVEPGKFAQRLVNLGAEQGDETELVSGCREGEKIVAKGSVFLQFANSNQ